MLLQLFSNFIKTSSSSLMQPTVHQNLRIKKAVEYIHKNLNRPITLTQLAGTENLSCDYSSRLFLKIMGTWPIDYMNRKRMESAQIQLITTNDPIEKEAIEKGLKISPISTECLKGTPAPHTGSIESYTD